jgi:hypothetical protein
MEILKDMLKLGAKAAKLRVVAPIREILPMIRKKLEEPDAKEALSANEPSDRAYEGGDFSFS